MRVVDKRVRKGKIWKNRGKGFTLAELLIVVAIIAVLVAISIPIFTSQLHKAKVAADWANLRAYYAEIQTDFITTGEYNSKVPDVHVNKDFNHTEITFLNGQKIKLQAGIYYLTKEAQGAGYQIIYYCNKGDKDCTLELNVSDNIESNPT